MKRVYNGHSNKSGVYKIINISNGRIYIGSCKVFKQRSTEHLKALQENRHSNRFLQHDFNKCGESSFEFHVVKVVLGEQKARLLVEQQLINKHYDSQQKCYNIDKKTNRNGRSCRSKTPKETRKKMSISMKKRWKDPEYRKFQSEFQSKKTKELWQDAEYREKHVEAIRNFTQKPEYRKKLSKAAQGKEVSKETRKKISKSVSKLNKKLWQDPEYREKVIEGRKRSWAKDEARKKRASDRLRKLKQKTYKLRNPEGEVVIITNMQEFCAKSSIKLIPQVMSRVARGKQEEYKGWTSI